MSYHSLSNHILGKDPFGVIAYRYDENQMEEEYSIHGIFLGIRGQCVEYARRWLLSVREITFPSVPDAVDIWNLDYAIHIRSQQKIPFVSVPVTERLPKVGDLAIYNRHPLYPHGHVAVVVYVSSHWIGLAEQNMSDKKWTGNCSRYIPSHTLADETALLGWKTL